MMLAIIGTGFTGTSMLINLYEDLAKRTDLAGLQNVTILTIEERPVNGCGYAYDTDNLLPAHLLNLAADKMAIVTSKPITKQSSEFEFATWKSNDFTSWMQDNADRLTQSHPELMEFVGLETKASRQNFRWGETFYPRALFGLYLQQRFNEAVRHTESLGVRVISYNRTTLLNIRDFGNKAEIAIRGFDTKMEETLLVDKVLLATGRWFRKDAYLSSPSVLLPFPAQAVVQASGAQQRDAPSKRVIVLGMGLTGIDAIFSVLKGEFRRDRQGKLCYLAAPNENQVISMSRIGQFSMVKDDEVIQPKLRHFTDESLQKIRQKNGGYYRLADLLVLLENELAPHIDGDMSVVEFLILPGVSAEQKLLRDMELARAGNKVYGVVQQLLGYQVASKLSPDDKAFFVRKVKRHFLRNVAAMPYVNAEKLLALFEASVLVSVCVGNKAKIKSLDNGKTLISYYDQKTGKPKQLVGDIMIRATGDTLNARKSSSRLIQNLLRTKTVLPAIEISTDNVKRYIGGIQIDTEDYAIIGFPSGAAQPNKSKTIYTVGMLAMNWGMERDFASASISATKQLAAHWVSELTSAKLQNKFLAPFDVFQEWSENAARNYSSQAKNYTIFSETHIFRSDPKELLEMADATTSRSITIFTNRISRLVCYKPEREALHWAARFLCLVAKVVSQDEYEQLVKTIYHDHILKTINFVAIYQLRATLESEVWDILRVIVATNSKDYSMQTYKEKAVYRIYAKVRTRYLTNQYLPGSWLAGETLEGVVQKLALDYLYDKSIIKKRLLKEAVFQIICNLGQRGHFRFHEFRNSDLTTFIVVGGVGSGKSSLTAQVQTSSSPRVLETQNLAIINRDKYRRLILDDQEDLYGQFGIVTLFAHDEITHVLSRTHEAYQSVKRFFNGVPCCVIEKNSPVDFRIADQLSGETACDRVRLIFLHLPIDLVMQRAFNRSMHPDFLYDRGKFLNPEIILAVHAGLSKAFMSTILRYIDRDCTFTILSTKTRTRKVIAEGNLKAGNLRIYDEAQLKEFLQKQYMNVRAKRYEDIYESALDYDQRILSQLLDLSKSLAIQFVDSSGRPYAEMVNAALKIHNKPTYNKRFLSAFPLAHSFSEI